jgi:hypothetical protein
MAGVAPARSRSGFGIHHHVVMRDGVLLSMLPRWVARRK